MKTRSQAKKEKLDKVESKVPHLNEDVLGIILKHVVQNQKAYVLETIDIIEDHVGESIFIYEPFVPSPSVESAEWPNYLDSNSRRLIHHTTSKLFPDCKLIIPNKIEMYVKSKRDLDLLWKTMKNFGAICLLITDWDDSINEESTAALFFQKFWERLQAPSLLVQKLEGR